MHSVKVYLKTDYPRRYRIVLFIGSFLLLINALLQVELPDKSTGGVVSSIAAGLLCLAAGMAFRWMSKRFSRITGLLLGLSGSVLAWTCFPFLNAGRFPYATWLFGLGCGLALLGLLEPILNRPRYLYISPNRLRLRKTPFRTRELSWANVQDLAMEDESLEIQLKKGRSISLKAAHFDNQHMRSHLHAIILKARANQIKPPATTS